MKSNISAVYTFILIIGDFIAIMAAFALAYILRVSLGDEPFRTVYASDYARVFALMSPFWILLFGYLGLYRRDIYEWRWKEATRLIIGSVIGIMGVITYSFASASTILPARIVAVYGFLIAVILLMAERIILRLFRKIMRRRGWGIANVMIVGNGPYAKELLVSLKDPASSGYRIAAIVNDTERPKNFKSGSYYKNLDEALKNIEKLSIHSIILTELFADTDKNALVLATAQAHHCGFRFIPTQEGLMSNSMDVELFQGMPVVSVHQTALIGNARIAKRLFDVSLALLGIITTLPLMAFIALIIRLSDWGPAIFKQQRLSRYNKNISIFKFRTMKKSYSGMTPEEAFEKMGNPELSKKYRENGDHISNDPRITEIGRFLRKTSLDELPQLFNVIRGDISMVGPRALVAQELENYPYKNLILSVKSGLTGLAQTSGRKDLPFEERRKLDLYYVQNWNFFLDIKIVLRTIVEIAKSTGAK